MPSTPPLIIELVERFAHDQAYRSISYKETEARQHLINPFFEALGWDMSNRAGLPLAQREVIHEARLAAREEDTARPITLSISSELAGICGWRDS